jgi:hypothetical protein
MGHDAAYPRPTRTQPDQGEVGPSRRPSNHIRNAALPATVSAAFVVETYGLYRWFSAHEFTGIEHGSVDAGQRTDVKKERSRVPLGKVRGRGYPCIGSGAS